MQIFLICVYFLVYLCVYIFTRVFHECFSRGICVQYGGFQRMKHACSAAIPVACTLSVINKMKGNGWLLLFICSNDFSLTTLINKCKCNVHDRGMTLECSYNAC